jgi:hypothetical protein
LKLASRRFLPASNADGRATQALRRRAEAVRRDRPAELHIRFVRRERLPQFAVLARGRFEPSFMATGPLPFTAVARASSLRTASGAWFSSEGAVDLRRPTATLEALE